MNCKRIETVEIRRPPTVIITTKDERDLEGVEIRPGAVHRQPFNTRKAPNPTAIFPVCLYDDLRTTNEQGEGVVRRGAGRIREGVLPRPEGVYGMELDIGEKVLSGTWDP